MDNEKTKPVIVKDGGRLSSLSTDELFQEIEDQGCRLANLTKLPPDDNKLGNWQCNLHEAIHVDGVPDYYEYGRAPTYRQAIMVALHNMYHQRNSAAQTYKRHVNRDFK